MKIFTKLFVVAAMLLGVVNVASALETYNFQDLCMKLGKGGPWAVNDGGDAGFTINDVVMHYLGDYTDQGFEWNNRFAYEYVEAETANNKMCFRNKNNKRDANCGLFSWDATHYFSVLNLGEGDKVTISCLAGSITVISDNAEGVDAGTVYEKKTTTFTITNGDRLDIQFAKATLVSKIEIEPFGVETVPVIKVTPATLKLIPTASAKLTASVSPAATTSWKSSDEAIATIASDGTVTAIAAGEVQIINFWESEVSDAVAGDTCVVTIADIDLSSYTIVNDYDFTLMGDVTLELGDELGKIWNDANSKCNSVYYCTNEGLEYLAVQAAVKDNKGWSIVDGEGLKLASGAGRCAAIDGLKEGQIIEFLYTGSTFATRSNADTGLDNGPDAGAKKAALNEGAGRAIYEMLEDGAVGFEIEKGKAVKEVIVYEKVSNAIESVNTSAENSAAIYNLVGQKVMNAQKGLYIINGKKYIVK